MKARKKAKLEQKLVVVALIRDGNGKVLVLKRRDEVNPEADGKWEFPGGAVDFGELPATAAAREVMEEVGCGVAIGRLLPVVVTRVWERGDGQYRQVFVLCYEAWHMTGTAKPLERYASEVRWCTPKEVAALDCLEGIPSFMAAAGLVKRLTK